VPEGSAEEDSLPAINTTTSHKVEEAACFCSLL
jgi:hypothetical protein